MMRNNRKRKKIREQINKKKVGTRDVNVWKTEKRGSGIRV